jgi:excisionase family DNA binding protein
MSQDVRSAATTPSTHAPSLLEPSLHDLLTVDDVAAVLKVTKNWVYEHTRSRVTSPQNRLPHIRVGKYLRFDAHDLRAYLDAQRAATTRVLRRP